MKVWKKSSVLYNYRKSVIIEMLYFNSLFMKNLPVAIKIVFNIIFYVLYSVITMNIINFLYDFFLHLSWKVVPASWDIVHLKIALVVLIFMLILTIIFRKYFYFSLAKQEIKYSKKKVNTKDNKKEDIKIEEENDEGIKIYMDKEVR